MIDIRTGQLPILGATCALFVAAAIAADDKQFMHWGVIGMQLFGGLALFLSAWNR